MLTLQLEKKDKARFNEDQGSNAGSHSRSAGAAPAGPARQDSTTGEGYDNGEQRVTAVTTSTGNAGAEDTPAYTEHDAARQAADSGSQSNLKGDDSLVAAPGPVPVDENDEQVVGPIDTAGQDDKASVQTGQTGQSGRSSKKNKK